MKVKMLLAGALVGLATTGVAYEPNWDSLGRHACPEWFKDAKFGIFIHWGPYSVPAFAPTDHDLYAEHFLRSLNAGKPEFAKQLESHHPGKSYFDLAAEFTARDFDAAEWMRLFKRAGAKYAVLTAKHHDGFCLWPAETQPYWNSTCFGAHRDLVREFCDAAKAADFRYGLYYSLLEHHPLYKKETIGRYATEINHAQLKELVEKYRPDIVWPDGEWDYSAEDHRSADFLAWLLNESSVKDKVTFNDRWGKSRRGTLGDFYTTEYGYKTVRDVSFFRHPWEECRGIGGSFGFNVYETPDEYMTSRQCIETLVNVVALGGNLLLNIGPDKEGRVPAIMRDRLYRLGDWLRLNGEAIYGTRFNPSRFADQGKDGRFYTERPDALYVIATDYPEAPFAVRDPGVVTSVEVVGSAEKVACRLEDGVLTVTPPPLARLDPVEGIAVFRIRHAEPSLLGNSAGIFERTKRGTVAYLGGSITANPGYRTSTEAFLTNRYPQTRFTFLEKGIASTCSNTGAFRLRDDILRAGTPDLLFVEFAVNDFVDGDGYDYEESLRSMEGIVRQARLANPKMDIVMMLFVTRTQLEMLQKGERPYSYRAHEDVARHYGVPVIPIGDCLKEAVDRGEFSWERWADCHPSREALVLVGKWSVERMAAWMEHAAVEPATRPLPAALDEDSYFRGCYNPLSNVEMNSRWFKGFHFCKPYWPEIPGMIRPLYEPEPIVWSTKPGEQVNFFFSGTAVGLFVLAGPDAGMVKAEVDGVPYEIDLFHEKYSSRLHYPYTKMIAHGLADQKHRVTLTVFDRHNPKSTGTAVRIYRIGINGRILGFFQNAFTDPAQPAAGN